ncbi:hypothetical protein EAG_02561 [Camponotus floridanus]|uniref:Uncharacterized protein n=1 Tax=Camponotus floridanus TaxID=104421 RepID=E1ZZR7_CAMFO|nr:hypothetical protein EAG_02561 [Camponotus floridanus]
MFCMYNPSKKRQVTFLWRDEFFDRRIKARGVLKRRDGGGQLVERTAGGGKPSPPMCGFANVWLTRGAKRREREKGEADDRPDVVPVGRSKRAKKRRHKTRDDDENRAQPGESQKRDEKESGREGKMKEKEEEEEEEREGETGRSKEQDTVYMTKKLPVPGSGEPVLPIIAAPRRPRDSPSSSHATRTSSDRPGLAWLDAPAAAATHQRKSTPGLSSAEANLTAHKTPFSFVPSENPQKNFKDERLLASRERNGPPPFYLILLLRLSSDAPAFISGYAIYNQGPAAAAAGAATLALLDSTGSRGILDDDRSDQGLKPVSLDQKERGPRSTFRHPLSHSVRPRQWKLWTAMLWTPDTAILFN